LRQDDLLARVQRDAAILCAVAAAMTLGAGGWRAALAVLGGGLLIGISFVSIRGALDPAPLAKRRIGFAVLRIAGRYALLGFLAYVMIARLRLPPLGLIAGASSVPAAVMIQAVRFMLKKKTTLSR
jgi:hypothetical protein